MSSRFNAIINCQTYLFASQRYSKFDKVQVRDLAKKFLLAWTIEICYIL